MDSKKPNNEELLLDLSQTVSELVLRMGVVETTTTNLKNTLDGLQHVDQEWDNLCVVHAQDVEHQQLLLNKNKTADNDEDDSEVCKHWCCWYCLY